jgi:hypothetical protein
MGEKLSPSAAKFLESKLNISVYAWITGLVRWAGKYIAKDDYTNAKIEKELYTPRIRSNSDRK